MNLFNQDSKYVHAGRWPSLAPTKRAAVEVTQYGDYTCLNCGRAVAALKAFVRRFGHQIRFSYRHFPREELQPRAIQAAEAAECARAQGRFWRMHEVLMANQDRLELRFIYDYAERAGLNMARFSIDMDDEVHLPMIGQQLAEGLALGVVQAPTYFVNGAMLKFSGSLATLHAATEEALSLSRETCS